MGKIGVIGPIFVTAFLLLSCAFTASVALFWYSMLQECGANQEDQPSAAEAQEVQDGERQQAAWEEYWRQVREWEAAASIESQVERAVQCFINLYEEEHP